ncbi:hypothetical protein GOBAR_AA24269 [Gossypium barbadense]|uniref:Uncharacterized protein n=1 Tax=Gossypium barbadense TaxID=3634 RepID=A0A2P5WZA1_GOSBA|nr:hypothetical protein GOBAR_AA24269 [Gossypium barbadense]
MGGAVVTDNVMERALKDVRDMGLVVVEDALKISNDEGIKNGSQVDCWNAGTFSPEVLIGPEEEKKKKGLNKKTRSMYEIQSSLLTSKGKKKMDRAKLKEKEMEFRKEDERIVNLPSRIQI